MRFIIASKAQEYLLESGLCDGVVLDPVYLRLDPLHHAEQGAPGGGGVRDVEVDVVQVLVSHNAALESRDDLALQIIQHFHSFQLIGFQFDDDLEALSKFGPGKKYSLETNIARD